MENNFYNDKENEDEFPRAFEDYITAKAQGELDSLKLDEDEFEYVLDRLIEEGMQEEVLELSELAFERYPYSAQILVRLCDTLVLMGNPDKALEILAAYKDSFSANSTIYFLFSRANIAKKCFNHARDYFYKALELDGDNRDTMDSTTALAQDCIDAGNYEEAVYYLDKASRYGELPYEFFNDYAFCYDRMDAPEKAEYCYNKYLDKNPFNDTVWFNMGTVQARLKNFEKAIEAFEYSIALNPENSSSLYNLAVVYMNLQRYGEAAATFEQFVQIDADVLGRLGLGEAYIRLEKYQEALEQFSQVNIQCGEVHSEALAGANSVNAILRCKEGKYEEFKEFFLKVLDTGTAWVGVIYDMLPFLEGEGWFLEFLGSIKR